MKILGTLTVDTPNALDKVTDLNADLLDGKSSELFLSRESTTGVYIADTAIVIDNSVTPTEGGGRLKIYDGASTDTDAKGISIGKLYSDSAADITTIDADLNISLATGKDFKLFTNPTGVASTNRLTVLSTGNVGINKANPTAKLQVHVGATETTLHPLLITASTKTLFDVDFSGNIGINTAANVNVQLLLQGERTSTHGSLTYGIKNDLTYVAASGVVASIYSMYIGTTITANTKFATAAALFIDEISVTGASTTKYGIYQVGAADSNVFNGATTFSNAFTLSTVTNTINIGGVQTTGVLTLGGVVQTGTITIGRSTAEHTLNIDAGAIASGTKTINIGTGGVATSATAITYGSAIGTTHTFNGNVCIGTTNPVQRLTVSGVGTNDNALYFNTCIQNATTAATSAPKTGINFQAYYKDTSDLANFSGIVGGKENTTNSNSAGVLYFCTAPNAGPPAERMRISSNGNILINKTTDDGINKLQVEGSVSVSGNVGIGTASPTEKLHVAGNILATGTVSGSNIFTQYHWSFTIAATNTSGCTIRSNIENTPTLCSDSAFYKRTDLNNSLGTTSGVNFSSYLICVYIKAGTNWEIVYPDTVIESGGVIAITFAADQHSNTFKVVMV